MTGKDDGHRTSDPVSDHGISAPPHPAPGEPAQRPTPSPSTSLSEDHPGAPGAVGTLTPPEALVGPADDRHHRP
jgi:hypothetical protein